jgi:hypothetical protein
MELTAFCFQPGSLQIKFYKKKNERGAWTIFSDVLRTRITGELVNFTNSCGEFETEEEADKALDQLAGIVKR